MNSIDVILSNSIGILYIGASFLIAFLCLFNVQGVNKSGNRWLGIFMLSTFFIALPELLSVAGMKEDLMVISLLLDFASSLIGPAFYYTVSYFVTPDRPWKTKDYFHLFPLALLYISVLVYAIVYLDSPQNSQVPTLLIINHIFEVLYSIQILYYCILSWLKLQKHQKSIRLFTSTIENVDLKWLKYIMACVLTMACFYIINSLVDLAYYYGIITKLSYLTGFLGIAYFSIKQKEIYPFTKDQKNEIIHTIIKKTLKKQHQKKLIENDKLEELKSTLLDIMENKKPFLDCELTLVKLAFMMDISLHQLSYLINTGFNENFYQFVNRYRIEEAKKLILDKKMGHLNFQGIAFEVGFNSKTVFNSTFKKRTGLTPSEYKIAKQYETRVVTSSNNNY